jgi:hypothetical protein
MSDANEPASITLFDGTLDGRRMDERGRSLLRVGSGTKRRRPRWRISALPGGGNMPQPTQSADAQEFRERAAKCRRLAGAVCTPVMAGVLRDLARDYEARAVAVEHGLPPPRSRWLLDGRDQSGNP